MAYDALGDGKTLVRGGFGKVYQYQQLAILATLVQRSVIAPTLAYDTAQVTSPAITGTFPVKAGDANATACLNPVAGPTPGEAVISPACRAFSTARRNAVLAGGFVNNTTTGPIVDGDRRMAYTWAFSAGVKRELARNMAVSVDYVGNRGRDNTGVIDINEGPVNAAGRVTRLGVNVFDPSGALVPLNSPARNTTFVQFNQEQTLSALNTDFNSLELELEKRYSNRWSGRVSYTFARCYDVAAIIVDSNPRLDYGRCDRDNIHASRRAPTWTSGRASAPGSCSAPTRAIRSTRRSARTSTATAPTNDRPMKGVNDLATLRPSLSAVDSRGVAIRNGISGEKQVILDGRFQYVHRMGRYQAGLFLEVYNLTNQTNFGNPTGARDSSTS